MIIYIYFVVINVYIWPGKIIIEICVRTEQVVRDDRSGFIKSPPGNIERVNGEKITGAIKPPKRFIILIRLVSALLLYTATWLFYYRKSTF